MRLVPAAIFHPHVVKVIADGVLVNPDTLLQEAEEIEAAGLDARNLLISDVAHLVMSWHDAPQVEAALLGRLDGDEEFHCAAARFAAVCRFLLS